MDVEKILCGDPLNEFKGLRWPTRALLVLDLMKLVGFLFVIIMFTYWAPLYLIDINNANFAFPKDISTVLIGGITIAVTLSIAMKQFHAKVKSENRQNWIIDVRNTLAEVIAHIPKKGKPPQLLKQKDRIKLELLMNPSEKDHRVLGWLLRRVYGIQDIKADERIKEEIGKIEKAHVLNTINKLDHNKKDESDELISYIIRLSNAILKREWERVKRGI